MFFLICQDRCFLIVHAVVNLVLAIMLLLYLCSNTMEGARQFLKMVTEFGLNVADLTRRYPDSSNVWTESERALNEAFDRIR